MSSLVTQLFKHLASIVITKSQTTTHHEGNLQDHDAEEVIEALGLQTAKEEKKKKINKLMDGAYALLEEKEASEEELEEAFAVFDGDGDGLISAVELRNVMRRLRQEEGMRLEDCKRMMCVYDEDGDGKISLKEFRKLLELAV